MTLEELERALEKLEHFIAHARQICDSPDRRGMPAPEAEAWANKLAAAENNRHDLLAVLTPDDRKELGEIILRKMEEQHEMIIGAALDDDRNKARSECDRLRMRWERISAYAGLVPIEVNGRDLLDEMARKVLKFVTVSKEAARILALWAMHTHVIPYEAFYHTPRLLIWSKEPESGKTTLANVLIQLVRNPLASGGVTGDGLLAILKDHNGSSPASAGPWAPVGCYGADRPTLLIDEADNIMQTQKLRRILNTGHQWSGVIRERNRRNGQMEVINTFAPLALFEIDNAVSTSMRSYPPLKTRSIEIELKQGAEDPEHDADPSDDLFNGLSTELRPKIEKWVETQIDEIAETYKKLKRQIKREELSRAIRPRARDNWLPLIAIADVAGGHWPQTVRDICVEFAPHRSAQAKAPGGAEDAISEVAPVSSGRVPVAKSRIMSALHQQSPQSRTELRLAGCKNMSGPDFAQALEELLAEGKMVALGRVLSGGKPKEMYGVSHVH